MAWPNLLWMGEILHRFEAMVEPITFVGIYRGGSYHSVRFLSWFERILAPSHLARPLSCSGQGPRQARPRVPGPAGQPRCRHRGRWRLTGQGKGLGSQRALPGSLWQGLSKEQGQQTGPRKSKSAVVLFVLFWVLLTKSSERVLTTCP